MIKFLSLLTLFLSIKTQAQEVYFSSGINLTTYDFKSTDNLPLELNSKSSQFYELGYVFKLLENKLHYNAGLAINGFDATAGDSANHYEWETTYMGLNNQLQYIIIPSERMPFELSAGLQMQLMHIINGEQKINGESFDLTKEKEFSGFWIQPGVIVTAKYFVSDDWQLSLGYNYSVGMNVSNSTEEKLKFNNQQIRFGIHFNLN
jgi:opacity protein-like surface antigen